jgi:hypothetical protein
MEYGKRGKEFQLPSWESVAAAVPSAKVLAGLAFDFGAALERVLSSAQLLRSPPKTADTKALGKAGAYLDTSPMVAAELAFH